MKVLQVLPNIQVESDGVSVCGRHLSLALNRKVNLEVHILNVAGDIPSKLNVRLYDISRFSGLLRPLNGLAVSRQMAAGVSNAALKADIVHAHGLWMMHTYYAYKATHGKPAKLCLHIHGYLTPWALKRSRLKKQFVLTFLKQRKALKQADLLIASCIEEYRDIRNFGLQNPIAIIPNGIEIPKTITTECQKCKNLVFLSRIHPKKGIDILLKSWKILSQRFPDWNLFIAGNDDCEHAEFLKRQCRLEQLERVVFTGELKGDNKYRFLSEAALFVLPTHSENFGIAVGEALVCGTPVVTTTGAPWSGLVDNDCGLWIELSVENLTRALEDMMSRPMEELARMGQNGREWMKRDFSWNEIAAKTIRSYEWLLDPENVERPEWIYLD